MHINNQFHVSRGIALARGANHSITAFKYGSSAFILRRMTVRRLRSGDYLEEQLSLDVKLHGFYSIEPIILGQLI
jgi:hypothetical protein